LAASAFEDALRLCDHALQLPAGDDPAVRAELLFHRGMALRGLGRWEAAVAAWYEALTLYETLGDAGALAEVCVRLGEYLAWTARVEEAVDVTRRGLAALEGGADAVRCRLLGWTAIAQFIAGDYARGDEALTQALAIAEELGDPRILGEVLFADTHRWYHMQWHEVLDSGLRAAGFLRSAGDLWHLAEVLYPVQIAHFALGHLEESAQIGAELETLANRVGHHGALWVSNLVTAIRELVHTGDLERLREDAARRNDFCRTTGLPWLFFDHGHLGCAAFWQGQWREAGEHLATAAQLEVGGPFAGSVRAFLLVPKAYAGEADAAHSLLREWRELLPRPGQPTTFGGRSLLAVTVEVLAVLGERDAAARLYPLVRDTTPAGAVLEFPGPRLCQTVAGIAAAAGRQWEQATAHFETALRQAHDLPHMIEQPEVRRWYAHMLLDRAGPGDRAAAHRLLTEAGAMYSALGMPRHQELAEQLRRQT
jgi:tetratricopeptide (TPR) repeat protein